MVDGALLRGYYYQRETPPARGRYMLPASPIALLCIPTELGNGAEYHEFALELAVQSGAPKRIYTLDLRGRGRSELGKGDDSSVHTDTDDLISFCDAMGLHGIDVLVSGRSSYCVLLTAPKRPSLIRKLIFNDGGPEFDNVGIARLTALRQRQSLPTNWQDAMESLKQLKAESFPKLTDKHWNTLVRTIWHEDKGKFTPNIQPGLSRQSNAANYDEKQLQVWNELKLFRLHPVLLIRGENSLLMNIEIAEKFAKHMDDFQILVAKGQGHVPLLQVDGFSKKILAFLLDAEDDT